MRTPPFEKLPRTLSIPDTNKGGERGWRIWLLRLVPTVVPALLLGALLVRIGVIALVEKPGHDESELLHASWLVAHGAVPWRDFFDNHSPIYMWLNAWLLGPDTVLYALNAKIFHLLVYLAGGVLFARACFLWLKVERDLWWSFLMAALALYLPMGWLVEFGVVRPEAYGFTTLFAAALVGHGGATSRRSALIYIFTGAALTLAVSFSSRTAPLAALIGLCILVRAGHRGWIALALLAVGGLVIVLADAAAAPPAGYYLWLIDFNGHFFSPYAQQLPAGAMSGVTVAMLAAGGSVALACLAAARRSVPFAARVLDIIGPTRIVALCLGATAIATTWLFVMADHAWNPQGFGGIAMASAFYLCILFAIALRVWRQGGAGALLTRLALATASAPAKLWGSFWRGSHPPAPGARQRNLFAGHGARRPGLGFWLRRTLGFVMFAAIALAAKLWLLSLASAHTLPLLLFQTWASGQTLSWRQDLVWLFDGWLPWAGGAILLMLALQMSPSLSCWRRGMVTTLAIRAMAVVLAMALAAFAATVLGQTGIFARLHNGSFAGIAAAFAATTTIGALWPRLRLYAFAYVLLDTAIRLLLVVSNPSQIVAGAVLGMLCALLLRDLLAIRQLGFAIGARGGVRALAGPSWRRIRHILFAGLPSWPQQAFPGGAADVTVGGPSWMARKCLAALFLAVACWSFLTLAHRADVEAEAAQQTLAGNFADMKKALTEKTFTPHTESDLLPLVNSRNLGQWLLWSRRYCGMLQGERVALGPTLHPVCVPDASFYWYGGEYLLDMKHHHIPFTPQPPFRLADDLRKAKPALLDALFLKINLEGEPLAPLLLRDYVPVRRESGEPWLYVRRDWLLRQTAGR